MKKITNFTEKAFENINGNEKVVVGGYIEKVDYNDEIVEVYIDPKMYTIDEIVYEGFMSAFFDWTEENFNIDEYAFEELPFYKKAEMIYKYEEFDEIARIAVFASEEDAKGYIDHCNFLRKEVGADAQANIVKYCKIIAESLDECWPDEEFNSEFTKIKLIVDGEGIDAWYIHDLKDEFSDGDEIVIADDFEIDGLRKISQDDWYTFVQDHYIIETYYFDRIGLTDVYVANGHYYKDRPYVLSSKEIEKFDKYVDSIIATSK